MRVERPILALSQTTVESQQLHQYVIFRYSDPDENYRTLDREDLLDDELGQIADKFQAFLDEDELYINSRLVTLHLLDVQLEYHQKDYKLPELHFQIVSSAYLLRTSQPNTIHIDSQIETLDYPCESVWQFPGSIVEVVSRTVYTVIDSRIILRAKKGDNFGGEERFTFKLVRSGK